MLDSNGSPWWVNLSGYLPLVTVVVSAVIVLGSALKRINPGAVSPSNYAESSPGFGQPTPRLNLVSIGGPNEHALADFSLQGKTTLLHFWGTWCGPCRKEYPELDAMASRLSRQPDFQFVSVSCEAGPGETLDGLAEKTKVYLDENEFSPQVYADVQGITRRSFLDRIDQANLFYPTSVLIGPDSTIIGVWQGYEPQALHQIESLVMKNAATQQAHL